MKEELVAFLYRVCRFEPLSSCIIVKEQECDTAYFIIRYRFAVYTWLYFGKKYSCRDVVQ